MVIIDGTNGFNTTKCGNRAARYKFSVLVIRRKRWYHGLREFSDEIFNSWGISGTACGKVVLLFVCSTGDDQHFNNNKVMHVTMGAATKKILTKTFATGGI